MSWLGFAKSARNVCFFFVLWLSCASPALQRSAMMKTKPRTCQDGGKLREFGSGPISVSTSTSEFHLGKDVLEENGGLCEGANPFAVAFHRHVFLFEGVTGTEEPYEALRKDGFQSLFVSQSDAREFFFFASRHVSLLFCVLDNGLWDEA